MQAVRRRDTQCELALRSVLHTMGLRYRVHTKPLPSLNRTADVVFQKAKIAVFVDGCFWHGCPTHFKVSGVNEQWWRAKIERTRYRDQETDRVLTDAGWTVVRIWAHEDPDSAAIRIRNVVRDGTSQP